MNRVRQLASVARAEFSSAQENRTFDRRGSAGSVGPDQGAIDGSDNLVLLTQWPDKRFGQRKFAGDDREPPTLYPVHEVSENGRVLSVTFDGVDQHVCVEVG